MLFKLTVLEFFVRLLPEGFFFVLAGYAYSRIRIKKREYMISAFLLGTIGFVTRLLPIQQGVYSILNLIGLMLLLIFINKIDTIKAITSTVIIFIITFMSEGLVVSIFSNVFHKDMVLIYNNPIKRLIYGMPSLIIVAFIVVGYYFILSRSGKLKNVSY
jgi:hypothetical protein